MSKKKSVHSFQIRGPHSAVDKDSGVLKYQAVLPGRQFPTFRKRAMTTFLGSKFPLNALFNVYVNCYDYSASVKNDWINECMNKRTNELISTGHWRTILNGGIGRKTEVLKEKRVPLPLSVPQIRNGLAWDRTHTFAVTETKHSTQSQIGLLAPEYAGTLFLRNVRNSLTFDTT